VHYHRVIACALVFWLQRETPALGTLQYNYRPPPPPPRRSWSDTLFRILFFYARIIILCVCALPLARTSIPIIYITFSTALYSCVPTLLFYYSYLIYIFFYYYYFFFHPPYTRIATPCLPFNQTHEIIRHITNDDDSFVIPSRRRRNPTHKRIILYSHITSIYYHHHYYIMYIY